MEGQDDLFTKNLRFPQPAHVDEEGPFQSLKEIEAHAIGNLLPDDKDLLSGLEPYIASDIVEDQDGLSRGSPIAGEHPYAGRPSRTLFVTNINSHLEDAELKDLFEKYGDIQTLNTTCKHRGFVTVSYYDIRAACDATRSLQDKPLRRRKLDIHFSIPKGNPAETDIYEGALVVHNLDFPVSNDDLHQIFGVYGEIKEIHENPYRHHKFIEFYDVRDAQAALRALKRSDTAEKHIRVEPSRTRQCLVQLSSPELEQGQSIAYFQQGSPPDSRIGAIGPVFNGAISSGCMENGTAQSMHSSFENILAITQLVENGLHQSLPPSGPHRSPSMSVADLGNTCRLGEPSLNLENIEFSFKGRPLFDPRTLPEYRDGLASGVPYRAREVTTNEHIHSVGLNGNTLEPNDSVFGSGNGSCPLHGQQYMWNNTNLYQHHPSNPLMWPNVPSFMNDMHVHPWQELHAHCPSTASHLLNSVLPRQHHMGSSPTLDPFLWQRGHVYEGDSHETSVFHPGILGNTALSGDSNLHQLELSSFPHHLVDLSIASANVGLHSSEKRYHMLPRRHSMVNMANSFDGSNEHVVSRRSEVTSSQADSKKQYDLNIDLILRGEDSRTTLMIKNIPNKYTSKMLLAAIDEHHRGTYNFIYLPIDFKNKCNVGYAFINMINPSQIVPFYQAFNGKKWEKFNSEKVASLAYARIQGKAALIAHFQNSSLMNEDKRCRPILFHSDGPNAGDQEPFPVGVNIRSKPGKHRTSNNEEKHQESTKGFSPAGSGISVDIWTSYGASIMVVSTIPFIVIQIPQIFHLSSDSNLAVLVSLIVAVGLLVSYCVYQVLQPNIQRRRLAFIKHKHVISGTLRHLRNHAIGRLFQDDGEIDEDVVKKLFKVLDQNQDSVLSATELRALIIGIQFEVLDLDHEDAVQKLIQDFDTSGDGEVSESEFIVGITKWLKEAQRSVRVYRDSGPHVTNFLDHFHHQIKHEHDIVSGYNDEEVGAGPESVMSRISKASLLILLGVAIAAAFADPLVNTVNDLSTATGIPSFFISFIVLPFLMNSSEATSALMFASRKKKRTSSLTFSEIYGSVTIHNLLCLPVFLGIIYVRGLTWNFSAEVFIIIIVCVVMGLFASFRTMFPLWTSAIAYALYPISLLLVYVLDYEFGWS